MPTIKLKIKGEGFEATASLFVWIKLWFHYLRLKTKAWLYGGEWIDFV